MRPSRVEPDLCNFCGLCVEVCRRRIFELVDSKITYRPEGRCIDCGHCMAVCPTEALVREDGSVPEALRRDAMPSPGDLLHFLRSRRSTRLFEAETPPRDLLEKLIEAARFAPTGSNKQAVEIVVVTDRSLITRLRTKIMDLYASYERHLANPLTRLFLRTFVDRRLGDPAIRTYLRNFVGGFREGRDVLFHDAPVLVVLHTGKEASTPKDDCTIALYHMVLMAERLGLGSCLLGTAEIALTKKPALNAQLGIPREDVVRAVACLGYPAVSYQRLTDRRPARVRWL